jgi:acyl carrier protein
VTTQESRTAEEIQDWLVSQLSDLLDLEPDDIDFRATLDTYGLASREAVMLSGDLEVWLGRRLSPTLVYEYPTIEALAQHLGDDGAGTDETDQDGVGLETTLARIEQLSEDEAEALLMEKLAALEEN